MQKFPQWVIQAASKMDQKICPDYSKFEIFGEESIYSCLLPSQIVNTQKILRQCVRLGTINKIVDGNAHIGCDTFNFALLFPETPILAVEIHKEVFKCLKNNTGQLKNVQCINDDILTTMNNVGTLQTLLFLDPPWGGKDYYLKSKMNLFLSKTSVGQFIANMFANDKVNQVLLKAPINFDLSNFNFELHACIHPLSVEIFPVKRLVPKINGNDTVFNIISITKNDTIK